MATLLSQAQALIDYANGVTGKSDTTLGDAVKSLADNYGGTSDSEFPDITDSTLLSSQVQALITYANSIDGESDTKLGDAMRHLADVTPQWMLDAVETYGIPLANLKAAYASYGSSIEAFFVGDKTPWITNPNRAFINTELICEQGDIITIRFKENIQPSSLSLDLVLWGWRWGTFAYGQNLYASQYCGASKYNLGSSRDASIISNTDTTFKIDTATGAFSSNNTKGTASGVSAAFNLGSAVYPFCLFEFGNITTSSSILGDEYTSINHLKIERDGVLQRFMIPAWNDTEVGMYDLANGKFYGSYNSQVFTYSLE